MTVSSFTAKVKSILSGDTIVLDTGKTFSLAYISAPRLNADEPYGYEAREYLRALLVGKPVRCHVHYSVNGRDYGDVDCPIFSSLIEKSLKDGNVKLRDDASSKNSIPELAEKFKEAQEAAKAADLGLWASSLSAVNVDSTVPEGLFGNNKTYPAVVERVISGDRIQLRTILNKGNHILTNVLIAGVRAPRSSSPDSPAEPFGDAAKNFTETRLLQRSVTAKFIASSNNGLPIVEVIHPVGNIAVFLLQSGLSSVADWQSQQIGAQNMAVLRAAEKKAKDAHLYLWKDLVTSAASASDKPYEATIARVISSDTFVLRNANEEEETVQLSSVRAPRKSDIQGSVHAPISKEFARKRFIGKHVQVKVDAIRPASAQFEERPLVTIILQDKNIAATLIESGYATVIRHRKDDTDRSPVWDELVEKETASIAANKGMHSKKAPPPDRTVDASENFSKAKGFLSSLERQGKVSGVVEHVSSGGRLRIHSARDNLTLTLVLSGVHVPRPQEPFGAAALDFVSRKLYQRDVQFTVVNVDKTGGFIGNVYIPGNADTLAVVLVKEGLAEVHEYSAQQSGVSQLLYDGQEAAQKAHKGLWKDYDGETPAEPEPVVQKATASTSTHEVAKKSYIDIIISNISSTGEISYRSLSSRAQYTKLSADLLSFNNAAGNNSQFTFSRPPRKTDYVTVSPRKGAFVRGRLIAFDKPSNKYSILEVDTGKTINVPYSSLRPLPSQFAVTVIPALAKTAVLSFIKLPPSTPTNYLGEFVDYLKSTIEGQQVVANVDSPATSTPLSVTLFTATSKGVDDSVNSAIVNDGYAFVKTALLGWEKSEAWKASIRSLKELETYARQDRVGVWEYGDAISDEE